jgi:oxygen-independent coproporphyrinogen-3 oxidase
LRQNDLIDQPTAMREALMMGLRLTEGISLPDWQQKFGVTFHDFISPDKIRRLCAEAYLECDDMSVKGTSHGLLRLNAVIQYLLA